MHRGGRIIQHVPDVTGESHRNDRRPRATHEIRIEAGSLLASIVGAGLLEVNSGHHQAVREPGRGLSIVARSPEGIIEAIEDPTPGRFFLGVQWHPEDLVAEGRTGHSLRRFARRPQQRKPRHSHNNPSPQGGRGWPKAG